MTYSKILVPIAPSHGEEAQRALAVAHSLVAAEGGITVITVMEDLPRYLTAETYAMGAGLLESQEAAGQAVVDEFSTSDVEVLVRHGHPARTIVDEAKQSAYDCIVIASGQPGWQHYLLGSTASGVVRHAHCSVHVVRHQDDT